MNLFGTYPFLVYVTNTFAPGSDVIFKVKCHRFRSYYDSETKNFISEISKTTPKEHYIEAGDRIAFPLYFGAESLEISIYSKDDKHISYPYYIFAGRKAQAMFEFDNQVVTPDFPEDKPPCLVKNGFYTGGGWEVNEENKDKSWALTIKKYGADPETDDVVIGSGPPA